MDRYLGGFRGCGLRAGYGGLMTWLTQLWQTPSDLATVILIAGTVAILIALWAYYTTPWEVKAIRGKSLKDRNFEFLCILAPIVIVVAAIFLA
jgi:hypothetical protein